MHYVGVDLHKHSISVCAMIQAGPSRRVAARRRFRCADVEAIHAFFAELGSFEAVVEATASYEWFVRLIEPLARRVVLAHPKKLRVIAESASEWWRSSYFASWQARLSGHLPNRWLSVP